VGGEKRKEKTHTETQNKTKHNQNIKIIMQIITIPKPSTNKQINHFKKTFHILNTLPTYKYIT